jgi:dienelactone hydrolase
VHRQSPATVATSAQSTSPSSAAEVPVDIQRAIEEERIVRRFVTLLLTATVALITIAVGPTAFAGKGSGYAVNSRELSLPSRGIEIPATVVMPVGKSHERFPLVVIHHGHGGGRNENGGLARVADALAKAGIMSIRFDFAGAGQSIEPFTKLTYTTMLADSNAALTWAVRNLPVDKDRIGGFGYSEGSAVVAMQAGQPFTPYKAVSLMGPVADPDAVFRGFFGDEKFEDYYEEAQANGFAVVTTPFGQVQDTSLEWFQETLAADPAGDIAYFDGRVQLIWGSSEQVIPFSQVEAFQAATADSAKRTTVVTIPEADHGYGFYSIQPEVDAILHSALVDFFRKALR